MSRLQLPAPQHVDQLAKGFGRAATIRRLRAKRCSPVEIATHLQISIGEVRRTLLRPVRRVFG